MLCRLLIGLFFGFLVVTNTCKGRAGGEDVDLRRVDRKIAKEPKYHFQPHYALLVFGPNAEHRSWLVVDGDGTETNSGRVLYLDRNGNGDLTEPGERIEFDADATAQIRIGNNGGYVGMNVFSLGRVAGVELNFRLWVRQKNYVPDVDWLRQITQEREANHWENGTLWRTAARRSQAQIPVVLTERPADAQIMHLDGPLTFTLKRGPQERIEPWPKKTLFDVHIGTSSLAARNCKHEMFSPLTLDEVPLGVHPVASFEFPPKYPDKRPIVRQIDLLQRCCGDTFYETFTVPPEAGTGTVRVSLTCRSWDGHDVRPRTFEMPFETQRSQLAEQAFVLFRGDRIGLEEATTALRKRGLSVTRREEGLTVEVAGEPLIGITLVRGKEVQDRAAPIGAGTRYAVALSDCNACLEISFRDLKRVLEEKTTLDNIELALKNLTHGAIYRTWDKSLAGPNE
ncbi:MAG TPA: hypothetical protein VMR25_01560 [Planctomycetaceae bacterium]|jgi:hypothetical protein|nr:hypothetical protein [Planctomycetaceae bacterium]